MKLHCMNTSRLPFKGRPALQSLPSKHNSLFSFRRRSTQQSGNGEQPTTQPPSPETSPQLSSSQPEPSIKDILKSAHKQQSKQQSQRVQPQSTDAVTSFFTRRFGIKAGLAWVAVLTAGVLGEQIKTRIEQAEEESATQDLVNAPVITQKLPNGLEYSYQDVKLGGGQLPRKSWLIVLHYKAYANGELFEDTYERNKPIVTLYGSRPFTGGLNKGVELALSTMKAGGQRVVTIPPELGFGEKGAVLRPTLHVPGKDGRIPGNSTLKYELELVRVSIPPS
jgi:FKBP-type peptidyl-prolyl cis-trans isomerase